MDDLHLVDELVTELEGLAIRTSQGSYVKMEDVRRLIDKKKEADSIQGKEIPERMTVDEARGMAREHLKSVKFGPQSPQEPGRSIAASEPQPSSRT
jgi:hypothetical protein